MVRMRLGLLAAMTLSCSFFIGAPMAARAADDGVAEAPVGKGTPAISMQQAAGDTLQMTCAQARALVKGKNGTILKTGATHFDRYHRRGDACERSDLELQPAFVRSKDNPLCFVGYTCETPEAE